jgi:UDP-GlcNAc:undecaprenyl-phosphate GlcNAc-1-phosphate transferase
MLSIYWGGEAGAAVRMLCLSLAAAIYGICDDIFAVKPWQKLLCQTLLAFCACLLLGTAQAFSFFGREYALGALSLPFTVCLIVFMMNAVNLVDGMDGLASGASAVSAAALAIILASRGAWQHAVLAAALCGACLGFLFHNTAPASIFMGETGSAFIGFALAVLSIPCFASGSAEPIAAMPLIFALPAAEASGSFLRRVMKGVSPFAPDKAHMHHVLYGSGLCVPLVCAAAYIFSLLCGASAVSYKSHRVFSVLCFCAATVFMRLMLARRALHQHRGDHQRH